MNYFFYPVFKFEVTGEMAAVRICSVPFATF